MSIFILFFYLCPQKSIDNLNPQSVIETNFSDEFNRLSKKINPIYRRCKIKSTTSSIYMMASVRGFFALGSSPEEKILVSIRLGFFFLTSNCPAKIPIADGIICEIICWCYENFRYDLKSYNPSFRKMIR